MKTVNTLKAIAAATILALSFNASAIANPVESDSNANFTYYIVNRYDNVSVHDYDIWTITFFAGESYLIVAEGDGDTDLDL